MQVWLKGQVARIDMGKTCGLNLQSCLQPRRGIDQNGAGSEALILTGNRADSKIRILLKNSIDQKGTVKNTTKTVHPLREKRL